MVYLDISYPLWIYNIHIKVFAPSFQQEEAARLNIFHVFFRDVRHVLSRPILILTFVAVAFLPILYSGFLTKGNWDPYGQLQNLPVAVVNLDAGATFGGKQLDVGNEFVETLSQNDVFDWRFVSREEARRGMAANEYYATITIPADFSAHAASLTTDNPQQAELIYEVNSYSNFIAGQISENATKELRSKLAASLTESYTRSIIDQFSALSGGLREAGEGAGKLNDGALQLQEGVGSLRTHLLKLSSGADELASGIGTLKTGAGKLSDGADQVGTGAENLSAGIDKVAAAAAALEKGAAETEQGTASLADGLGQAASGASSLSASLSELASGANRLDQGLASSAEASRQLAQSSTQLATELSQWMQSDAELAANASLQQLLAAAQSIAEGANRLHVGHEELKTASNQLASGQSRAAEGARQLAASQEQLRQGAVSLHAGQQQLLAGIKQLNAGIPELSAGSTALAQGARQVAQGAGQLAGGIDKLAAGANTVASGARQLASGATSLQEGTDRLAAGAGELAVKLTEAADKSAALKADDKTIRLMAEPVVMKENEARKIEKYALGIAPYFLSLSFLAGAVVFANAFSVRESSVPGASGFRLFVSKLLSFAVMGVAQTSITCGIMVYLLGLDVQSVPMFFAFTLIVSFTFMFMVQALGTWLDKPGLFIAIILLILQLVSSAGTFPYELMPGWAQALHPWLPMSYSVDGYRQVISTGAFDEMWTQARYLSIYLIASVLLTFLYFMTHRKPRVSAETVQ